MFLDVIFPGNGMVVHRDSDDNNCKIPFKFTAENMKRIEVIISKYPPEYKVFFICWRENEK